GPAARGPKPPDHGVVSFLNCGRRAMGGRRGVSYPPARRETTPRKCEVADGDNKEVPVKSSLTAAAGCVLLAVKESTDCRPGYGSPPHPGWPRPRRRGQEEPSRVLAGRGGGPGRSRRRRPVGSRPGTDARARCAARPAAVSAAAHGEGPETESQPQRPLLHRP